ncbi:B12-binding domain-containing radical SAM protein [Clostridium sp. chh4-2]|uniref:B12-binding domain-containing radical SAM protein n=1 Tax=Clostridium sp. chh4-2 TaxID=2067550 RepID=UPI000CCDD2B3|nr:B12-binding domain-containing radical SAM protein [Clostridium sp. chh4-2]PNV62303.1 B12-binding domain-containing radical SAM protein [Clostridium sp. chh4-2]
MKFLLAAINAKYIHSNLGIYSLMEYAKEKTKGQPGIQIEIGEYTINHQMETILKDIYLRKPDVVGFSCYIWNISYVLEIVRDLHKVLPDTDIWLGGPEVSYDAERLLKQEPDVLGIMMGEGEETYADLVCAYSRGERSFAGMDGIAARDDNGSVVEGKLRPVMDMSQIPFVYHDLKDFENRIIYYESSRGCPFSCSYCLSSIDKSVRFRDVELVKAELDFFLQNQVKQVKFVDRTFNCKKSHAIAIWKHILAHDNGITNFHFEISADLLGEEELELMSRMRPGLIQLEIGVQSTNPETIFEIRRKMDLDRLRRVVDRVNGYHNIHQHLDLIAGLPYEGLERFKQSFDDVYSMRPEQLQLGFLKVLKGSYMQEMVSEYGLLYKSEPPYEVLSTRWLGYDDVLRLKAVEEMVEVYYNSGQFQNTLKRLEEKMGSPYHMYEAVALYYEERGLSEISHNRPARYEVLYDFICEEAKKRGFEDLTEEFRDLLVYDLYLRENVKSRPSFARDQGEIKTQIRDFFIREAREFKYLKEYEGYDSRQISKMAHIEGMADGTMVLFDYKNRDPLTYNAKTFLLTPDTKA